MEPREIAATVVGIVALIIAFLIFAFKSRGLILIFKAISDTLWATNYILKGQYVACIVSVICILRGIVFFFRDKRTDKQNTAWLIVFLVLVAFSPAYDIFVLHKPLYILLPSIGSVVAVFAFYQKKASMVRLLGVLGCVPWLIYTIVDWNLMPTLNSGIQILIGTIMIFVLRAKEKKELLTKSENSANTPLEETSPTTIAKEN